MLKMTNEVVYKPTQPIKKIYSGGSIETPKFMPSYYEYLALKGNLIIDSGGSYGTTTSGTIYTVPSGYTLYLTSVHIDGWVIEISNTGQNPYFTFLINSASKGNFFRILHFQNVVGSSSQVDISFNYPLKCSENSIISYNKMYNTVGFTGKCQADAIFSGFLVKNTDIFL